MESSASGAVAHGSRGCAVCGSAEIDAQLHGTFGVTVCTGCARDGDDYKLLSRTRAKEKFLLSDSDLAMLQFLSKPNPRNEAWKPVKLYLLRQCRALSWSRWGDAAGLEQERLARAARREQRQAASAGHKRHRLEALATGGGVGEVLELGGVRSATGATGSSKVQKHPAKRSARHRPSAALLGSDAALSSGDSLVARAFGLSLAAPPVTEGYVSAARGTPQGQQAAKGTAGEGTAEAAAGGGGKGMQSEFEEL